MAGISTALIGGLLAAGATAMSVKASHDQNKAAKQASAQQLAAAQASKFDAKKETEKATEQEALANRRRVMSETNTIKTTALGNTGTTETKKKTLLGG